MSYRGKKFTKQFVVGFGFLSGIFLAVGIDPEGLIIENIINLLAEYNSELAFKIAPFLGVTSIIILLVTLYFAYKLGGIIGIIAIFFALIGGFIIFAYPITGISLLFLGLILGYFAPTKKFQFL